MALVIKEWELSEKSNNNEAIVFIHGREEGILSWLLSLFKIDPSTSLSIFANKIELSQGSWEGNKKIMIPTNQICSAYFGYTKPWKIAVILFFVFLPVIGLGIIIGPLYYFLNKQLELAVVANSGDVYSIAFKRSIIEGINIDEEQGHNILNIIEELILKNSGK
jgi:hypothetical protein